LPIIQTKNLAKSLENFKSHSTDIYTLSSHAQTSYKETTYKEKTVFVLGNESDGVSREVERLSSLSISIPMNRGVESLNVAVTASLLSFL